MKYKGKTLTASDVNTTTVSLQKGADVLVLKVAAQSPGFIEKMESLGLMDQPNVPYKEARNGSGQVIRDKDNGNAPVTVPDYQNAEYRKRLNLWNERYLALALKDYLRMESNLEFSVTEPTSTDLRDWHSYADTLRTELFGEGGFTDAEAAKLTSAGRELGCVVADIDSQVDDFLPKG